MVFLLLSVSACTHDSDPPSGTGRGESGALPGAKPTTSQGDFSPTNTVMGSTSPVAPGNAPSTGGANASGTPGDSGAGDAKVDTGPATNLDGSAATNLDGGAAEAASPPFADTGTTPGSTQLDIPAPVTAPFVWGVGIGISDMPSAVKFYTEVMKMSVEKDAIRREDRTETTLYASQAKRGARLVLMNFDDKRNTRKIAAKLVWQASNPSAINSAASRHPDYVSRLNLGIVQFDGPETYIQEVGSIFDSGATGITAPYLIVLGFSVSDLAASRRFYTSLGMDESRTGSFRVTDATGSANITEYSVKWSTGSALILQDWNPERTSKDNPIKVVLFVPDAQAIADKLVAVGGSIARAPERTPVYDNRLLIVAKDPDGYVLELVQ